MSELNRDVEKHVAKQCATYAGKGQCLIDRPCPFFENVDNERARCFYYENGVLPTDDKLQARYWARFEHKDEGNKVCKRCDFRFKATDKREQYCTDCKGKQKREKARDRKRAQRVREQENKQE